MTVGKTQSAGGDAPGAAPAPTPDPAPRRRGGKAKKAGLEALYGDYRRCLAASLPASDRLLVMHTGDDGGGGAILLDSYGEHPLPGQPVAGRFAIMEDLGVLTGDDGTALKAGSLDGILMLDGLQFLPRRREFFRAAGRVLRPGGRLIMLEPGVTPLSNLGYRFLFGARSQGKPNPLAAREASPHNPAIATWLFKRQEHRIALSTEIPELRCRQMSWRDLLAWPLSGGDRRWNLLPRSMVEPLLRIEGALMPFLGMWMAWRLLIVMERRGDTGDTGKSEATANPKDKKPSRKKAGAA